MYNLKTQMLQNSKCDKTKKLKSQQNSKTQNVAKHKISNSDKAWKLRLWLQSKTLIVAKFKDLNCDKSQNL